jgi:hypothetical protein
MGPRRFVARSGARVVESELDSFAISLSLVEAAMYDKGQWSTPSLDSCGQNQGVSVSPWTFSGESAPIGGDATVTMVDGTTFMVCARSGDVVASMSHGLFMLDTRVLSHWALRVDGSPVQALSVTPNGPFSATFVGRIDDPELADAPLAVIQRRHVGRGMREDLEIRNHGSASRQLHVELHVGADFSSLFDVKAGSTAVPTQPAARLAK